ncbi:MAG: hypothetical protein FJ189_08130, partial [Gammaproteobacteria bacterium]|nr:hypothetical protein [Gammaproteobacteria bacterium]
MLVLASCAGLHDRADAGPPAPTVTTDRYLTTSADAVIGYAATVAGFDAAERVFECHRVLRIYRVNRQLPILIHLFIAQTASSGCGDLRSTTREVRAMRGQIANSMVRDFVTFQLLA